MGPVRRELNELSQVSLVGAFALDEVGDCPAQWRDPASGAVAAPHLPSFDEPGLSLVFKRLFPPYCEVQFLFEEHLGARLLSTFEAHAAPTARPGAGRSSWLCRGRAGPELLTLPWRRLWPWQGRAGALVDTLGAPG